MKRINRIIVILILVGINLFFAIKIVNYKSKLETIRTNNSLLPTNKVFYNCTVIEYQNLDGKEFVIMKERDNTFMFYIIEYTDFGKYVDQFKNKETGFVISVESFFREADIKENKYPLSRVYR